MSDDPNHTPAPCEVAPLRQEFDAGYHGARDEAGFAALEHGQVATTTKSSEWFYDFCKRCKHTFRLGDQVKIASGVGIVHESGVVECGGELPEQDPNTAEFFAGLDDEWPAPADVRVTVLESGHPLLAPPFADFPRARCVGCGHTFRRLDLVVVCPCSPSAPLCQAGIHRDPIHNLSCLDSWNPTGQRLTCPITSRKLEPGR